MAGPAVGRVQEDAGRDPSGGVRQLGAKVAQHRHQHDGHGGTGDHLGHAGHHGQRGEAQALDAVTPDDQRTQRHEKHAVPEEVLAPHGDDLHLGGRVEEEGHDGYIGKMQDKSRSNAVDGGDQQCAGNAFAHAVHPGGTQVLARVGGHGRADALQRDGQQVHRLAGGGDGGDSRAAQHVDGPLHDNAADGRDAALQAHRHADAHQADAGALAEGELAFLHMQHLKLAAQEAEADHAGDGLGNIGGQRCAEDSHLERHDEQKIQADVQGAGQDQEVQRRFAVAQGAHDAGDHVVQKDERDAGEDPANIDDRAVQDVLRRLHQHQQRASQGHRGDGKHYAECDAQPGGISHMAAQVAVIPCAEQLSDGDGKTIADANDEAQDQVVDGAGGADRRQRTDAAETAYDDGICQRVKLLEQIAQHKRQGEEQDHFQRIAAGKVFCHNAFISSILSTFQNAFSITAALINTAAVIIARAAAKSRGETMQILRFFARKPPCREHCRAVWLL